MKGIERNWYLKTLDERLKDNRYNSKIISITRDEGGFFKGNFACAHVDRRGARDICDTVSIKGQPTVLDVFAGLVTQTVDDEFYCLNIDMLIRNYDYGLHVEVENKKISFQVKNGRGDNLYKIRQQLFDGELSDLLLDCDDWATKEIETLASSEKE